MISFFNNVGHHTFLFLCSYQLFYLWVYTVSRNYTVLTVAGSTYQYSIILLNFHGHKSPYTNIDMNDMTHGYKSHNNNNCTIVIRQIL